MSVIRVEVRENVAQFQVSLTLHEVCARIYVLSWNIWYIKSVYVEMEANR